MFLYKFKNERGVTLVELLAGLALLSLMIALATGLIVSIGNNQQAASSDISLQQDTNVLINEMRQAYYERSGEGDLPVQIDKDKFHIKEMIVNESEVKSVTSPQMNFEEPQEIKLITASDNDQTVTVETTFRPTEEEEIALEESDEDDGKCSIGEQDGERDDELPKKGGKGDKVTIKGDAVFSDKVTLGNSNTVTIEGDAFFCGDVELKNGASITIEEEGLFKGKVELKNGASITIEEDGLLKGKIDIKNSASITIEGNGMFEGEVDDLKKDASITIYGNGMFEGEVDELKKDATITIKENGTFKRKVVLKKSKIDIEGDGTFKGKVNGKGTINIDGDGTFKGEVDKKGTITIEGDQSFENQI